MVTVHSAELSGAGTAVRSRPLVTAVARALFSPSARAELMRRVGRVALGVAVTGTAETVGRTPTQRRLLHHPPLRQYPAALTFPSADGADTGGIATAQLFGIAGLTRGIVQPALGTLVTRRRIAYGVAGAAVIARPLALARALALAQCVNHGRAGVTVAAAVGRDRTDSTIGVAHTASCAGRAVVLVVLLFTHAALLALPLCPRVTLTITAA